MQGLHFSSSLALPHWPLHQCPIDFILDVLGMALKFGASVWSFAFYFHGSVLGRLVPSRLTFLVPVTLSFLPLLLPPCCSLLLQSSPSPLCFMAGCQQSKVCWRWQTWHCALQASYSEVFSVIALLLWKGLLLIFRLPHPCWASKELWRIGSSEKNLGPMRTRPDWQNWVVAAQILE